MSWQQKNGAFPPVGKVWNKEIQAGVNGDQALTAYVTVALLESGFVREVRTSVFFHLVTFYPPDSYNSDRGAKRNTVAQNCFGDSTL